MCLANHIIRVFAAALFLFFYLSFTIVYAENYDVQLKQLLIVNKIPQRQYEILHVFPHNHHHFTEGLEMMGNDLLESTGLYGESTLKKTNLKTGRIVKGMLLPKKYFGEGVTVLGDKIYQLTYRENTGFIYNKHNFKFHGFFNYDGEGWGMTNDGKYLIMSNGSSTLYFIDPHSFKIVKKINVSIKHKLIKYINELEFVKNKIYANVWPTSIVVKISPTSGQIEDWMDISPLTARVNCPPLLCVANGIAYRVQDKTFIVTGKYWPYLYQIKIKSIDHRV